MHEKIKTTGGLITIEDFIRPLYRALVRDLLSRVKPRVMPRQAEPRINMKLPECFWPH